MCLLRLNRSTAASTRRTPLRRDISDGWSYFRSVRWLWPVSLAFFVVNLAMTGPWQILGPQLVSREGGPQGWGLILSASAVGLLVMSMFLYRFVVRHHLRVTMLAGVVGAVPLLGLGLGLPTVGLIAVAVIGGAASSASAVTWDSALQEHIPQDKLSRVAALDDLLSFAAIPVS